MFFSLNIVYIYVVMQCWSPFKVSIIIQTGQISNVGCAGNQKYVIV